MTREHYFKSADEMAELFADLPEALDNTIEIAKRCAFRPKGRKPILPRFVAVDGDDQRDGAVARSKPPSCAARPSRVSRERLAAAPLRRRLHASTTTRSASPTSSTSSRR